MTKFVSMLLVLSVYFSLAVFYVHADSLDFSIYYNSKIYTVGESIHYTGDTATVTIKSSTPNFNLEVNGKQVDVTLNGVLNYTLTNPGGPILFNINAVGVDSQVQVINFYKDVPVKPDASYLFQSVYAVIEKVENTELPNSLFTEKERTVDYSDGADEYQVNNLFDDLKSMEVLKDLQEGGTYTLHGYLIVRVFDNEGNSIGDYSCRSKSKLSGNGFPSLFDYPWDSDTKSGFYQRSKWASSHTYEPEDPALEIVTNFDLSVSGITHARGIYFLNKLNGYDEGESFIATNTSKINGIDYKEFRKRYPGATVKFKWSSPDPDVVQIIKSDDDTCIIKCTVVGEDIVRLEMSVFVPEDIDYP